MASVTKTSENIPAIILQRLKALRRKLASWILVDGFGKVFVVICVIAAIDMVIDRQFKMDFAQRTIMLFIVSAVVLTLVYRWLFRPFGHRPNDDALILEVENKNKELNESLISSMQLSREKRVAEKGMSPSLVASTIEQGLIKAKEIDFGTALNKSLNGRNWAVLLLGVLGIGGIALGVMNSDFLKTWFNRNVMLSDDQWPQNTYLTIVGVNGNQLVLDRGTDHVQVVTVDEESRVQLVEVVIEFDYGSRRTIQKMTATGKLDGREHQVLFSNVATNFRFRARGGDDVTPWVQVELVEPIDARKLTMTAQFPEYTGITRKLEGSGPHSVLEGSKIVIEAETNMPVNSATLGAGPGQIWDFKRIDDTNFTLALPDDIPDQTELAGGKYTIELADESGRKNLRPIMVEISVSKDGPPKVLASLSGISGLVVPRARIPITFKATDRYGLTRTFIEYGTKGIADSAERKTGQANEKSIAAGDVKQKSPNQDLEYQAAEVFELEHLEIPPSVVLQFSLNAVDNHPGGEGIGKSREFLLRVVTEDELRADLLRREMEQRKIFEQAKNNQIQLLTDLRALAATEPKDDAAVSARKRNLIDFQGRQNNVGTNMFRVSERFEDFLKEAENNRLDESEEALKEEIEGQANMIMSIKTRYRDKIIVPISKLEEEEVYLAARSIEEARRMIDDPAEFSRVLRETAELQELIVKKMEQILAAMEDSQTYQEIVNLVISLKKLEQDILGGIKDKKNDDGGADIFDDDK